MLAEAVDGDDVGVTEGRRGSRLLFEWLQTIGVRSGVCPEHFNGHIATQHGVIGLVDLTYARLQ